MGKNIGTSLGLIGMQYKTAISIIKRGFQGSSRDFIFFGCPVFIVLRCQSGSPNVLFLCRFVICECYHLAVNDSFVKTENAKFTGWYDLVAIMGVITQRT